MKINATKSGKSLGKCDAYWRRGSGSHVPRTCYDCANFVTDNYGDVQSCMIDTSGLCVDRSNSSTPSDFWLAQANRSYCESNDTSCTTCLEAKPKSFTSLCDGAGGCFCTKQCKDAIRAGVVDDSSAGDWFTPIYLSAAVVAFVTAVWIVYRGRRRTRSAQLQVQVGSGYETEVVPRPPQSEYTDYSNFTATNNDNRRSDRVVQ